MVDNVTIIIAVIVATLIVSAQFTIIVLAVLNQHDPKVQEQLISIEQSMIKFAQSVTDLANSLAGKVDKPPD